MNTIPSNVSINVYKSPEFKAFCERYGIAWEKPTTKITIILDCAKNDFMRVQHEYIGRDGITPAA